LINLFDVIDELLFLVDGIIRLPFILK